MKRCGLNVSFFFLFILSTHSAAVTLSRRFGNPGWSLYPPNLRGGIEVKVVIFYESHVRIVVGQVITITLWQFSKIMRNNEVTVYLQSSREENRWIDSFTSGWPFVSFCIHNISLLCSLDIPSFLGFFSFYSLPFPQSFCVFACMFICILLSKVFFPSSKSNSLSFCVLYISLFLVLLFNKLTFLQHKTKG